MNPLGLSISRIAIAALLGIVAVQYVQTLRAERTSALEGLQTARNDLAARDATIKALRKVDSAVRTDTITLANDQATVRTILVDREVFIRNIEHENPEIRAWADLPVPADIASMHDHPAFTGAAAYREQMRPRHPLPPAGSVAAPPR